MPSQYDVDKMHPDTAGRRLEARLKKAVDEMEDGEKVRVAAKRNHVPKSTAFDRLVARRQNRGPPCRTTFTKEEETRIVDFVVHCSDLGVPLNREHVIEATMLFLQTLPAIRQEKLRFKDGRPGKRWVRDFYGRHTDRLRDAVPFWQEQKRFAAANAEVLTSHLATLNTLYDM